MKKIVYSLPDGRMCVVNPVINTFPALERITEDEAVWRAMKDVPEGAVNVTIVDHLALPRDRYFRDAWVINGGAVEHDMDKCRAIHRTNLRYLRTQKFTALDVEFMRAQESGDHATIDAIIKVKQELRDVTALPAIDSAATPDELKTIMPECLK